MDKNPYILIKKIAGGDKEALRQFLSCYGGFIKSAAFRVLKDSSLCDDVLNDMLLKIWENAYKMKNCKNITGYIYAMAYNHAIDYKRKQKDTPFDLNNRNYENQNPAESGEKMYIDGILEEIEEPYRSILILKAKLSYNFFEIAKLKNISYKQARSCYLKAAEMFKNLYEKGKKQ